MIAVCRALSKQATLRDELAGARVYVGLGSNTPDADARLQKALAALAHLPGCRLVRASHTYHTEPQGYRAQAWFSNAVAELVVVGSWPEAFLVHLLALEAALGRVRDPRLPRFGPRAIDLDLLLYGALAVQHPACTVPHPRMHLRAFVLCPLLEIAPDLVLYGKPLSAHLANLVWRQEGFLLYQ